MTRDELFRAIRWSPIHRPEWDSFPERYAQYGLVNWNKSRRLGRVEHRARGFKAYLGLQHFDNSTWGGDDRSRFFVSLWRDGHCDLLQTHGTMERCLDHLWRFYESLRSNQPSAVSNQPFPEPGLLVGQASVPAGAARAGTPAPPQKP